MPSIATFLFSSTGRLTLCLAAHTTTAHMPVPTNPPIPLLYSIKSQLYLELGDRLRQGLSRDQIYEQMEVVCGELLGGQDGWREELHVFLREVYSRLPES